jgi:GNAT superfamily N-acetyltransferase
MLLANPNGSTNDIALVLALDGERVVGRLGCFAGPVKVGGESKRAFFLSGFALDPEYRQTGVGGLLLMRILSAGTVFASGAPDLRARELYRRLKFHEVGPLRRFLLPLRAGPVVEYYTGNRRLGRYATSLATPAMAVYRRLAMRHRSLRVKLRQANCVSSAVDAMMERDTRNSFPRDAAMYAWAAPFSQDQRIFDIEIDGDLAGFAVLSRYSHPGGGDLRLPPTTISALKDYYLAPSHASAANAVLCALLHELAQGPADFIECQVEEAAMAAACQAASMIEMGGNRVFVRGRFAPGAAVSRPWFIAYAVGDQLFT